MFKKKQNFINKEKNLKNLMFSVFCVGFNQWMSMLPYN